MQQVLSKRVVEDKISEGYFNVKTPQQKQISYNRQEDYIIDMEIKLMKKYRKGFSSLHKYLIAKTYQQEFGNPIF